MHRKSVFAVLAVMVTLSFATGLAFAKTQRLKIDHVAKLADGPQLAPGSYKVAVLNAQKTPEVVFYKGKAVVAKVAAKLVAQPRKAEYTEITFNTAVHPRVMTDLLMSGSKTKLVFANPTTKSN